MRLPPVQPVSLSDIYVNGDVTIDDSAVIAPGTILVAAANSRIIIRAGACVGMGVILNAHQGTIEIEKGAVVGSGVLIIGSGKIGQNACIGSLTTIFNGSVEPCSVIVAGSLIGDNSRQDTTPATSEIPQGEVQVSAPESIPPPPPSESIKQTAPEEPPSPQAPVTEQIETEPEVEVTSKHTESTTETEGKQAPVVGQVYINQLLLTLFPERRNFQNTTNQNNDNEN